MEILTLTGIFLAISSPVWVIILIKSVSRHFSRKMELGTNKLHLELSREVDELRGQLSAMKERIQVLEAIITDKGYHLREQFKKL